MEKQSQKGENLRKRIAQWKKAFEDKTIGINHSLGELIWNYAVFTITVRIVRISNDKREEKPPLNQMLFEFISQGYWSHFLIGVRRLLDKSPINGSRGVYSLRSVVKDIEACRTSITRRVYVEWVCGNQYDLERLGVERWGRLRTAGKSAIWGDGQLIKSEYSHREFDNLSGVFAENRSEDDLIDPQIFIKIEKRLAKLDSIGEFVSSHIAHAGNEESRGEKNLDKFDTRDAEDTLKSLKEIADLMSVWFSHGSSGGLAHFIGYKFEGLDQPLVQTSEIEQLEERWNEVDRYISSWSIKAEDL